MTDVVDIAGQQSYDPDEVGSEEATQAFLRGNVAVTDQKVRVGRGDQTGWVSADQLPDALGNGWEIIGDKDAQSRTIRREENDVSSLAVGAVERGLAGATLGLSSLAEEHLLGVDAKRMKARSDNLGVAGDAIEIGAGLLGGGVGAAKTGAARGASALLPARGATMLGELAETGLRKAIGEAAEGGVRQVLQRAIPIAGRGFVEGFAYGVGAEIDESVLGEREISAERLLASGALGGVFGGASEVGMRVGLPAIMGGSKKLATESVEAVMGKAAGVQAGSSKLAKRIARGQALISGAPEESLERLWERVLRQDPDVSRVMSREGMAQVNDEIAGALKGSVDDLIPRYRDARQIIAQTKLAKVDAMLPASTEARMMASTRAVSHMDEMAETLSHLRAKADDVGGMDRRLLSDIEERLQRVRTEMAETGGAAGSKSEAAAAFEALDTLKREIDHGIQPLRRAAKMGNLDADRTLKALGDMNGRTRALLMDESIWGEAGAFQRELNDALSGSFRAVDEADNLVARMFKGQQAEIDPGQALSLVRRYGRDLKGQKMGTDLESILDAQERIFAVAEKYHDLSPAARAEIAEARAVRKKVTEQLAEKAELAGIADDWTRIRSQEGMGSPSITAASTLGPSVGGLLGGTLGGLPGAAVGAVAGAATRPYTTLRTLAGVQDLLRRMEVKTGSAVDRFLAGKGSSVGSATLPGLTDVGAGARRGVRLLGAQKIAESNEERYERLRDRLPVIATNPTAFAQAMDPYTWVMDQHAPAMAGAVRSKAVQGAQFLLSKLPVAYTPPMGDDSDALVDPVALARFNRYAEAVEDPLVALDRVADGTVTKEHAEALRVVYPQIFADVQTQVMDRMAQAKIAGERIPHDRKVALGILFDVPTVSALQPMRQAMIQQSLAGGREGPGEGPGPKRSRVRASAETDFAGRRETEADRISKGLEG